MNETPYTPYTTFRGGDFRLKQSAKKPYKRISSISNMKSGTLDNRSRICKFFNVSLFSFYLS